MHVMTQVSKLFHCALSNLTVTLCWTSPDTPYQSDCNNTSTVICPWYHIMCWHTARQGAAVLFEYHLTVCMCLPPPYDCVFLHIRKACVNAPQALTGSPAIMCVAPMSQQPRPPSSPYPTHPPAVPLWEHLTLLIPRRGHTQFTGWHLIKWNPRCMETSLIIASWTWLTVTFQKLPINNTDGPLYLLNCGSASCFQSADMNL